MIDMSPKVTRALDAVTGAETFYFYPDTFTHLPCVSFYEANNAPHTFADDTEYAAEIVYVLDVWGNSLEQVADIAAKAEKQMTALGFIREFAADIRDPASKVRHKTMRFKLIKGVDEDE